MPAACNSLLRLCWEDDDEWPWAAAGCGASRSSYACGLWETFHLITLASSPSRSDGGTDVWQPIGELELQCGSCDTYGDFDGNGQVDRHEFRAAVAALGKGVGTTSYAEAYDVPE